MKPYPAYKDSGIEWIGEIPEHWRISALKHKDFIIMGQSPSSTSYCSKGEGIAFLQGNADFKDLHPNETVWSKEANKIAQKNDVLVSVRAPIGAVNLADKAYGIGRGLASIRVKESSFKFTYYLMISAHSELNSFGTGSTYKAISSEILSNTKLSSPPLEEQTTIANFLDHKTTQIDAAIEKHRQLIELLQEHRAAIINEAVTKGINPNVPMKDSGIEWIGEVPEHWEIKRLKHISPSISVGLVINPSTYYSEKGTVPMLTGKNVLPFQFNLGDIKYISEESSSKLRKTTVNSGDLVTVRVGYPGVTAVIPEELDGANCASIAIIRKPKVTTSEFLAYCFNSKVGNTQIEIVAYGAAQKQFNISHLVNFYFPIPPLEEQQQIVNYIEIETTRIDEEITLAQQEIDLLEEYRQSLIAEAVTGKIDVRDYPLN